MHEVLQTELEHSSKAKATGRWVGQEVVHAPPVPTVSGKKFVPGKATGVASHA
jgi:hypothetical protein